MDTFSQLVCTFALQEVYSPLYPAPDPAVDSFHILLLTDFFLSVYSKTALKKENNLYLKP